MPPVPTGLALSPASDSGQPGDNRTNDATPTITGAGGISGDTVTLLGKRHCRRQRHGGERHLGGDGKPA